MPPLDRYIDLHCERTQPGLFEEPFNLLSGSLFLVVAYLLWGLMKQRKEHPFSLKALIVCCATIGLGSMTYHSFSKMWAAAFADALPIAVTSVIFLYMLVKHILRCKPWPGLMVMVAFVVINIIFKRNVPHAPDGYISLIPTLMFLFCVSIYMFFVKHPSFQAFGLGSLIACIALFFRVIDQEICDVWPYGTHCIWHALMAVYFYLMLRESILRYKPDTVTKTKKKKKK